MLDTTRHEHDKKKKTKTRHETKNNMNTIHIHKYVKIIWIKENASQNLYNTLNTTRHEKKKTRIRQHARITMSTFSDENLEYYFNDQEGYSYCFIINL